MISEYMGYIKRGRRWNKVKWDESGGGYRWQNENFFTWRCTLS